MILMKKLKRRPYSKCGPVYCRMNIYLYEIRIEKLLINTQLNKNTYIMNRIHNNAIIYSITIRIPSFCWFNCLNIKSIVRVCICNIIIFHNINTVKITLTSF